MAAWDGEECFPTVLWGGCPSSSPNQSDLQVLGQQAILLLSFADSTAASGHQQLLQFQPGTDQIFVEGQSDVPPTFPGIGA